MCQIAKNVYKDGTLTITGHETEEVGKCYVTGVTLDPTSGGTFKEF